MARQAQNSLGGGHVNLLANWDLTDVERALIENHWPREAAVLYPQVETLHADALSAARVIAGGASAERLLSRGLQNARAHPESTIIAGFVIGAMIALAGRTFKMHEALAHNGSWSPGRKAPRMDGAPGGEPLRLPGRTLAGSTEGPLS
jgi:hypothetical protein